MTSALLSRCSRPGSVCGPARLFGAMLAITALVVAGCSRPVTVPAPAVTPTVAPAATPTPVVAPTVAPAATPAATPPPPAPGPATPAPPKSPAPQPTPQEGLFLDISEPANESVVNEGTIVVRGFTTPDAVVSVDGDTVEVDAQGEFAAALSLESGTNLIEVVASDMAGNQESAMLAVIYIP